MATVRDFGPKRKFIILLLLIHVVVLPALTVTTYGIVKKNAVKDAYTTGRLYLSTVSAMKHYVAEELRPVFYREMPGRFVVEGMSRSYVASNVADRVEKQMPHYIYKNASLNPKNPRNAADPFEAGIIGRFVGDRSSREWTGYRTKNGDRFYVIATPGQPFEPDCLRCHGDPGDAPKELVDRYGREAGFHIAAGSLNDATFVYIPISVPIVAARNVVLLFVLLYGLFGTAILIIINARFSKLYDTIESDKQRIEDINLELVNLNQDIESIIAERTMNLIALSVADRIRNPATTIAATMNRMLRKEEISGPLREKIVALLSESERLDSIVKDYETILRTRHTRFKPENINELVESVLPLVKDELENKEIFLIRRLPGEPIQCMVNRQLFRIAVLHIIRNAIEAAPQKGTITVENASSADHASVSITDNGMGIAAEDISRIFTVLYSTKRQRLGMGLPIARQIVEEHKGVIKVESEPGRGTTVRIILPLRWTEKELARQAE